jgi:hypothetical protein
MTKRWIFRIGDLTNNNRPVQPGVTITRRGGNGLVNLPKRKRGKR